MSALTLKQHSAQYLRSMINEEKYLSCDLNINIDDLIL